ncbi:hypothetical protein BH24ACI2_BH24ACI2_06670 [soil metagenome]|jgi:hypothetical protein|nr:hypothetical protein [Acidobacteriota bacterium]
MVTSSNDDHEIIFVASYWNKKAKRRIYARSFGLKAFPIRVKKKDK